VNHFSQNQSIKLYPNRSLSYLIKKKKTELKDEKRKKKKKKKYNPKLILEGKQDHLKI